MDDSKANRVPLMIRLDADLHRKLTEIVRGKYDDGDRQAALNTEINDAVRERLHNLKEIESLQVDAGGDRILGVPSVPRVLGQVDAGIAHSISAEKARADHRREVAELSRDAEDAERHIREAGPHGEELGDRKRRPRKTAG